MTMFVESKDTATNNEDATIAAQFVVVVVVFYKRLSERRRRWRFVGGVTVGFAADDDVLRMSSLFILLNNSCFRNRQKQRDKGIFDRSRSHSFNFAADVLPRNNSCFAFTCRVVSFIKGMSW